RIPAPCKSGLRVRKLFHRRDPKSEPGDRPLPRAVAQVVAPARPPEDPRVRGIGEVEGGDAALHRSHDQLEIWAPVEVGDGRGGERSVDGVTDRGRGKVDPKELDAKIVEDVKLPDATRVVLGPGGKDHLGVAVVIEIDHDNDGRSEEHTSELQSRFDLVCRLLLEKKKR